MDPKRPQFLVLFAALSACTPPTGPGNDGGTSDSGTATILDGCLNAPALPEAPRLTDWNCPAGWQQLPAHEVTAVELANGYVPAIQVCAPPPLPATCPVGQRVALGSSTCQPVGDACPAGDFPTGLSGTVLYVKPGGTGNGSSPASPLGTISQAVTAASPGSTIAIARGTYVERVALAKAVTLHGACAEQTIITGPSRTATLGTIDVVAAATIKNVQVTGPRPGIWIFGATVDTAKLQGVIVRSAELTGIFVTDGARAQLDDVLIQDTLADPANGLLGGGLRVRTGGKVTGTGVVVEKSHDVGFAIDGTGSTADLAELVVRDTLSETATRTYGMGMEVRGGATAVLTRTLFERNRNTAMVSDGAGSKLTLRDAVLQDTLPQESDNRYGGAFDFAAGTSLELERVLVRRMRGAAIRLGGMTFKATDLVVAETEATLADQLLGMALVLDTQTQADVTRAVFSGNRTADILVSDRGTRLTLTDARLRGVRAQATNGKYGIGFIAMQESVFNATRLAIEHTDDSGGFVQGKSLVTLTDLSVRDTGFGGPLTWGDGLVVQSQAQATVLRAAFRANRSIAVAASTGGVVQLTDLTVSDVGTDLQGFFGRAVVAQFGAIVSVTRADVQRAREAALYSYGANTRLYVDQASVLDTQPTANSPAKEGRAVTVEQGSVAVVSCLLARGNKEVAVNATGDGSHLTLNRARLLETAGIDAFGDGVVASLGATVVLEDVDVEANQNLGVAFARAQGVMRRVRMISNAIGLYTGEGSVSKEVAEAGAIVPLEVQVEQSCAFVGNQTRIAGDFVPVPAAVDAAPARSDFAR